MDHPQGTSQVPQPPDDDLQRMLRSDTPRRRSTLTLVLAAVALVAVGLIGGLFVGKRIGDSSNEAALPGGFGPSGPGVGNGGGAGLPNGGNGQFTFGTIEGVDGDTLTVTTADGNTVKVEVGDDTQIQVTKEGSISDLTQGTTIIVTGSRSGDTLAADSISEGGGFGGAGPPTGASG